MRCTGEWIFIFLFFQEGHLSCCIVLVRFCILHWFLLSIGTNVTVSSRKIRESTSVSSGHSNNHWQQLLLRSSVSSNSNANNLAAICEPSMLLKDPVKFNSLPGSSVLLTCPYSTQCQWPVHYPLVFKWVVVHWLVLNPTSSCSSKALQSVLCGKPHHVKLLHPLSGHFPSHPRPWNTMPLHHAFPSVFNPRVLQVHLKTATLSDNTSSRVNGILA